MHDIWLELGTGTARASTPILMAAIGALMYARAGTTCLAIEGFMIAGALASAAAIHSWASQPSAFLVAIGLGSLLGYAHEWLLKPYRQNYVLIGMSMVLACTGATTLLGRSIEGMPLRGGVSPVHVIDPFSILHAVDVFSVIAVGTTAAVLWSLRNTTLGIDVRAAASELNADVEWYPSAMRMRNFAAAFAGACGGAAGFYLVIYGGQWSPGVVGGRGWLAVLATIIAARRDLRIILVAYLFGFLTRTDLLVQASGFGSTWLGGANRYFLAAAPYLVCLLVLTWRGFRERSMLRLSRRILTATMK